MVLAYISRLALSLHTAGLCFGERARYRGGGQDLRSIFSPFLCWLDGRGRCVCAFLAGGGVLEVRLARLAESVCDPIGGLARPVQTTETFGISLAGCFSCLVVCSLDAAHSWDMFHLWGWQVRSPASGGCYEILYDIYGRLRYLRRPLPPWPLLWLVLVLCLLPPCGFC